MESRAHYTPEPAWGPQSEEGAVWNWSTANAGNVTHVSSYCNSCVNRYVPTDNINVDDTMTHKVYYK